MQAHGKGEFGFGPFALDPVERSLFRDGKALPLTSRGFDVLHFLVLKHGRLVTKDELMRAVWPDTFVEEGNLTFHIHALRKILGDHPESPTYIETVPRRGYRFVADVRTPETAPGAQLPLGSQHSTEQSWSNHRFWFASASTVLVLITAVALMWRRVTRNEAASLAAPLIVQPFITYEGEVQTPAFSPDGERIAFSWTGPPGSGRWDLYVRLMGSEPALRLTSEPGIDLAPAWSPDGRQIAFLHEQPEQKKVGIYVIGSLGGAIRKVTDLNYARYFDLSWSADGDHIAYAEKKLNGSPYDDLNGYAISEISLSTLEKRQVTFPPEGMSDHRFAFSPDGKLLAFLRYGYEGGVAIFVAPAGGGAPRLLYTERSWIGHVAWDADGRSLVFTSQREGESKFYRVGIEGGSPQSLLANEEMVYMPTISKAGNRLAYVREYFDSDLFRVKLNGRNTRSNLPQPFIATARVETCPAYSPDGKKLAFFSDRSGKRELWLSDADGTNAAQLTDFWAWSTAPPSWSSDSKQLLFYAGHGPGGTGAGIFILSVDDKSIRRVPVAENLVAPRWSHDGKWIYASSGAAGDGRIWKISPDGKAVQLAQTNASLPQESPDGKFVYYLKWPAGIWRMPSAGGKAEPVIPEFQSQIMGHWQVMGDGIFFVNNTSRPYATIEFYNFSDRKRQILASLNGTPTTFNGGLTVSPDRKQIVYSQDSRSATEIMLVENFH